jgi:hypothetical protein
VTCGQRPGRHDLLSHLADRPGFYGQHALDAVAEGDTDPVKIPDHLLHADGFERQRVIGALPCVIEREMLFDDPRTNHVGDRGHRNAVVVVRQADNG